MEQLETLFEALDEDPLEIIIAAIGFVAINLALGPIAWIAELNDGEF
jgi:hypothetical protein